MSLNDKLAAYFRERPHVWIDGMEIAKVAGHYAWRSRCSDLRRPKIFGGQYCMSILNRMRRTGDFVISEYMYVPQEGDAPAPVQRGHDLNAEWGLR